MRHTAIALPALAAVSVAALAAGPAAMTSASAAETVSASGSTTQWKGDLPVQQKYFKKYHLSNKELRQIAEAKRWADNRKARQVRQCESGGNYNINTGNGYYGAWQFNGGTWLGSGGKRYAYRANQAPKFAQDHIAWKLWKSRGWSPWSCA